MSENIGSQSQADNLRNLRDELNNLRAQVENFVKNVDEKGRDAASDVARKIAREIERCRHKAERRAEDLREAGQAGLNDAANAVRQNPLLSLVIAFGVGCVVSCLFRHLR